MKYNNKNILKLIFIEKDKATELQRPKAEPGRIASLGKKPATLLCLLGGSWSLFKLYQRLYLPTYLERCTCG